MDKLKITDPIPEPDWDFWDTSVNQKKPIKRRKINHITKEISDELFKRNSLINEYIIFYNNINILLVGLVRLPIDKDILVKNEDILNSDYKKLVFIENDKRITFEEDDILENIKNENIMIIKRIDIFKHKLNKLIFEMRQKIIEIHTQNNKFREYMNIPLKTLNLDLFK